MFVRNCYKIFLFSNLSQKLFLNLAKQKLTSLNDLAQEYQSHGFDSNLTDQILKINSNTVSIVINTQTPNRQIWYSSTNSGPQRFNYQQTKWINTKGNQLEQVLKIDLENAKNKV